jgi:hypothetical protein
MRVDDGEGIALAAVPRAELPFEIHAPSRMRTGDIGKRLRRCLGGSYAAWACRRESSALEDSPIVLRAGSSRCGRSCASQARSFQRAQGVLSLSIAAKPDVADLPTDPQLATELGEVEPTSPTFQRFSHSRTNLTRSCIESGFLPGHECHCQGCPRTNLSGMSPDQT